MAKILITGATGFVGRSLLPALIALGHEVVCAVRVHNTNLSVKQIAVGNLEEVSDWTEALHDINVVIHLAAKVHVMEGNVSLQEFCSVNTDATMRLAEQAAQCGVQRFIFMSSIKVNGEATVEGAPFTEQPEMVPEDPYGKSKYLAEQQLLELSQKSAMDVVILRPSLVFGPGVKANFLKMIQLVSKGLPLPFSGIDNKRTFVFVDNLVSAIIAVLDDEKASNQIYLVADDESWSLSGLLTCIAQSMNKKSRLFKVPGLLSLFNFFGLSAMSTRLFGSLEVSNNKIKEQLGWTPPVKSAEGIARTVRWYKEEYKA